MSTTKMTRLEAINTMMSIIGEPPVNSLTGVNRADVTIAQSILDEVSRDIQSEGWHFNSLDRVPFLPDSSGYIVVPNSVVRLDLTQETYGYDIVVRSNKIYNKFTQTDIWPTNTILYCSVVYLFDFEELPQAARQYIALRAGRIFCDRVVGDTAHHNYSAADEQKALATLKEYEGETGDHTIFDNYSIGGIVDRPSIAPRVY